MWKTKAEEIKKDSKGRVNAKIIERGGTSLKSQLCKLAPVEQERCNDLSCKICSSNSNRTMICRRTSKGGLGYNIQCNLCKANNINSFYHGETSRTLYTRIKEHMQQEANKPLIKHNSTFHPEEDLNFDITPTSYHQDPLSRQINEGVRINNSKSKQGYLMNSKTEFHQGEVPRVTFLRGLP